ncbi:MAG: PDZ domain-containing protein [FCB group bacterium]|nr:PDZ domain-containing protein [FCB group bacterium]
MKRHILNLLLVLILTVPAMAESPHQQQIYKARDRVLPALIHIQPVVFDYKTGREKKLSVVGSGVIISTEGYAVTNYHVAGRAERIICTLHDREQVPATLVGGDPATDLAVIKLDLSKYEGKLVAAKLGSSSKLQVGQSVLAMGSPLALSRSVSMGVISTVNRFFPGDIRLPSGEKTGRYNTWLQTDAAINPGNSGGPLVNFDGEVVGINTRGVFFAENIGFSIPIDIVKQVSKTLIASGKVERSWIGVHAQPMQDLESFFGADTNRGVLIASVDPGSPAEEAGLQAGEVILSLGGKEISARFEEELPEFYQQIALASPHNELELIILAGGEKQKRTIIPRLLGKLQGQDFDFERWKFTAKAITTQMAIDHRLDDTLGVFVTQAKSQGPASAGGLRRRDVIKQVNKQAVENLEQLTELYESLGEETKTLLTIDRRGDIRYVLIKLDEETPDTERYEDNSTVNDTKEGSDE